MKEIKIKGWQDVFSFTFIQTMKEKSTILSFIIISIIVLLSVPVSTFVKNKINGVEEQSKISTVYIKDETAFTGSDYSQIASDNENYKEVTFVNSDKSIDELTNLILEKEENSVIVHITEEDSTFLMRLLKNPDGNVKNKDLESLSELMKVRFEDIRIMNLDITREQYDMAYSEVKTSVYTAESIGAIQGAETKNGDVEVDDGKNSGENIGFLYVLSVLPVFLLVTTGAMVASSILMEKSSKAVEYLMISIRPLAIIVGKVLAMFCVILIQFSLMGITYIISTVLNGILFSGASGFKLSQLITPEIQSNLNLGTVILILFLYLFAFLFYNIFASLFGATVSKIEELQEGLSIYTITALVGFYLAYFLIGINMTGQVSEQFIYVVCLLPISAPFIVPGYLMLGKIPMAVGLGALAIQIGSFILLTLFVSKVYETLILHNGNRLKVKDLITIFKNA